MSPPAIPEMSDGRTTLGDPLRQDGASEAARILKASAPRDLQKEGLKAARRALQSLQEANPLYADLVTQISLTVHRKPGASSTARVIRAIISNVLTERGALMSQTALRKLVEQQIGVPVFKDWTHPLKPFAVKRLPESLRGAGTPFAEIDVKRVRTLADLHREAGLAVSRAGDRPLTVRARLSISGELVYLGDKRYKVQTTRSGKYQYQTVRIPVDDLRRLAEKS